MEELKGFDEMTVAELHAYLTERGKAGDGDAMMWNTKTRKPDLVTLAKDAHRRKNAADRPGFTEVYGGIPDLSKPVATPTVDEARQMVADFHTAHSRPIDLPEDFDAYELTPDYVHMYRENATERHAARMAKRKTSATNKFTERRIIKTIRASQSRRYNMDNGRGMGAKHYALVREMELNRYADAADIGGNPDALKPLSYADRVRHYAVQNGQGLLSANEFPGALLTARQWRRAQHKQNKNRAFGTKEARYL